MPRQDYARAEAQRFSFKGMVTYLPPDRMPAGKYPLAINARAYLGDALTPRLPQTGNLLPSPLSSLIHSLRRMDDTTVPPTVPTSVGPNGCGTGTDTSAPPSTAWANPGNITVQDGNYATVSLFNTGTGATVSGPSLPTVAASLAGAGVAWLNPNNIKLRDGVYSGASLTPGASSNPLQGTGYGFSVPTTVSVTITGIVVTVYYAKFGRGVSDFSSISLDKAGVPAGSPKGSGTLSGVGALSFGSSSDLWGTTWTPADVNGAGFGAQLIAANTDPSENSTVSVDAIEITVYYTLPSGAAISDYLLGTNFGFAIGGGVSVSGIVAQIKGLQSLPFGSSLSVTLLKAGVAVGTAKIQNLTNTNAFITLGNSNDLWGAAWVPGDINNSQFGVQIQAFIPDKSFKFGTVVSIDFVQITIYGFASAPPVNFVYIAGAGTSVYAGTSAVATGMSGKRLALVPFRPNTSVAPWMYVGDSAKLVKIRSDGTTYKVGITEPQTLPTISTSGAGPLTGNYSYAYVYRSSKTGAQSNGSPTAHSVTLTCTSNAVSVTCTSSSDPQVDLIDVYRFGGALIAYTYITTILNSAPQFVDNISDVNVGANPIMSFSNYEPFPSIDLPKLGTLTVTNAGAPAGTVLLTQASGDVFNVRWTYGTIISVSQTGSTQATNLILFNRPSSTAAAIAQIQPVGGTLPDGLYTFVITGPILAAQPLPALWGPTDNTAFMFGCGDPLRTGTLYFTTGNNPDAAAQTNSLELTGPNEPLIGGCIVNGLPLVMSSERGWLAYPNFSQVTATIVGVLGSPFSTVPSITDRGLVCKEGICTDSGGPSGGGTAYYIAKDSIRASAGGVGSQSITDDLYNLFPHEGQPQQYYTVAGITVVPPDYTQPDGMALRFSQGYLYFDYIGIDNNRHTLVYDAAHSSVSAASDNFSSNSAWSVDIYAASASIHADNPGMFVSSTSSTMGPLLGCTDGTIRQLSPNGILESGINMVVATPTFDAGDQRATKQFGDIYLETTVGINGNGIFNLALYSNRYTLPVPIAPATIPASAGTRVASIVDINSGQGVYALDVGLIITVAINNIGAVLHLWQPSSVPQAVTSGQRNTDWEDMGNAGTKFIQGVVIEADTGGVPKNFVVQLEDLSLVPLIEVGSGAVFNGRSRQAFSFANPVVAHQIRINPLDTVPWRLWSVEWIWVPFPELADSWTTELVSHGVEGYLHIGDINIPHLSTADLTLTLTPDIGNPVSVTIPNSGGSQAKVLVTVPAIKCKLVGYSITSAAPFRLWKQDVEVKVGQWGRTDGYRIVKPFGGQSAEGAEV